MATDGRAVRRGLPRHPGGEPWPPAAASEHADAGAPPIDGKALARETAPPAVPVRAAEPAVLPVLAEPALSAAPPVSAPRGPSGARSVRRGLPRTPGGDPWPAEDAEIGDAPAPAPVAQAPVPTAVAAEPPPGPGAGAPRRRGLPRTSGGEPWPPAGTAPTPAPVTVPTLVPSPVPIEAPAPVATSHPGAPVAPAAASERAVSVIDGVTPLDQPLPMRIGVRAGRFAFIRPPSAPAPHRIGPFTRAQWAGAGIVVAAGLLFAGAMAVFAVRWLLSTAWGHDFLAAYPGEYHLPDAAPVGLPAWLAWQHFFNVFFIVLIIRSGLQVRHQKKPPAFWSPRGNPRRKISISLWLHQSLDILWIVNGVVFVVLLFVTGQWMRIVPSSWDVFPNALSAVLQYVSLDWPTENGWVNYNAVQQLAYFTTVFVAAPLAIATGVRMSGVWPKNAARLNKAYPIERARAVHFPTMIYFVLFIVVHVTLVFATGALRNLNHMYAAQGSTDPSAYADNWAGAGIFAVSMLVIVGAWIAARPLVLAPIARLFGSVSGR